jgi:hypothetical protein
VAGADQGPLDLLLSPTLPSFPFPSAATYCASDRYVLAYAAQINSAEKLVFRQRYILLFLLLRYSQLVYLPPHRRSLFIRTSSHRLLSTVLHACLPGYRCLARFKTRTRIHHRIQQTTRAHKHARHVTLLLDATTTTTTTTTTKERELKKRWAAPKQGRPARGAIKEQQTSPCGADFEHAVRPRYHMQLRRKLQPPAPPKLGHNLQRPSACESSPIMYDC